MNIVLEKLGIYDLVAVLFSGMCILTLSVLISPIVLDSSISFENMFGFNETALFLIGSYLVGLIFQEAGSVIQKGVTHRKNRLLAQALSGKYYMQLPLQKNEKKYILNDFVKTKKSRKKKKIINLVMKKIKMPNIFKIICKKLSLKKEKSGDKKVLTWKKIFRLFSKKYKKRKDQNKKTEKINIKIYTYCEYILEEEFNNYDKELSLAASSRSLSFYWFIIAVITDILIYYNGYSDTRFGLVLTSIILFLLFYYRCERLYVLRYTYILRDAYNKIKKEENRTSL